MLVRDADFLSETSVFVEVPRNIAAVPTGLPVPPQENALEMANSVEESGSQLMLETGEGVCARCDFLHLLCNRMTLSK